MVKAILRKVLIRLGEEGARIPSARGCYEADVPTSVQKKVLSTGLLSKKVKKSK